MSGSERVGDGDLVEELTAGDVDEQRAWPHQRDRVGVDEVLRLGCRRRQREHDVRAAEQVHEARLLESVADGVVVVGVVHQDLEPHRAQHAGQVPGDHAVSDQPRRLAAELGTGALRWFGAVAIVDRRVGHVPGDVEQQRERDLGGRGDEALVGVGDEHAVLGRGSDVDRRDVDRGPEEGQQIGERREDLCLCRGGAVGDDHVAPGGVFDQLGRRQVPVERVGHDLGERSELWQRAAVVRLEVLGAVRHEHSHHVIRTYCNRALGESPRWWSDRPGAVFRIKPGSRRADVTW